MPINLAHRPSARDHGLVWASLAIIFVARSTKQPRITKNQAHTNDRDPGRVENQHQALVI